MTMDEQQQPFMIPPVERKRVECAPCGDFTEEAKQKWMAEMHQLAAAEGMTAVLERLRVERDQMKNLTDEFTQVCLQAMKKDDITATVARPVGNAVVRVARTTAREDSTRTFAQKPSATAIKATQHYDFFMPNHHTPFIGEGSYDVEEGKLRVECVVGSLQGRDWLVKPMVENNKSKSKDVKIGRSSGKVYRESGLSLSKDSEVSTNHAAIFRRNTGFYYKDMKSSNGSWVILVGDAEIRFEAHRAYEISNGMQIRVGGQTLQFNF